MSITFSDVVEYRKRILPHVAPRLQSLEQRLIEAREEYGLPIYLTKWRVKSTDSIYLKTKRKEKSNLDDITDYGGFRILCLFEQDIPIVHQKLVKILHEDDYNLVEFRVFNWEADNSSIDKIKEHVTSHFVNYSENLVEKDSGYKSIHYVVRPSGGGPCIEIQLRTLLQDVWAELEHSLSYKQGSIHPHIKKSFALLSRDLATDDKLIAHLRDVRDKERFTELFALSNAGPYGVFDYEKGILPEIFETRDELRKLHQSYVTHVNSHVHMQRTYDKEWIDECARLLDEISHILCGRDLDDKKVRHWMLMEKAFVLFCRREHDRALDIYVDVIKDGLICYVPFFRKGEIHFIKGEIERSLVEFDKSEELQKLHGLDDVINAYRLKVKLANTYWLLGEEYYGIALKEILEAERIQKDNRSHFTIDDEKRLVNNVCWYQLEVYIKNETEENFQSTLIRFSALEPLLDRDAPANLFDTASWFCYVAYKKTKDGNYLQKAKDYCKEGWGRKNNATHNILSVNMHRNHTQEIMSAE